MKELAAVVLVLAITFGARAVLEVAWYRYRSRTKATTRIGWGPDSIGLPRPIFLGLAAGLVLGAGALLLVVGFQFGGGGIFDVLFWSVSALVLIVAMTAYYVFRAKSIAKRWARTGKSKQQP